MINIRFRDHRTHSMLNTAIRKLIVSVLLPNRLEIEIRAVHQGLQELQVAGMAERFHPIVELILEG